MNAAAINRRAWLASFLGIVLSAAGGQTVIDFSAPEYTPEGRLKSLVRGSRALIAPDGDAHIENLRLEIFPENGQNVRIAAPVCRFLRDTGVVESSGDVDIRTPGLTITGTGFRWEIASASGVIRSNVTVTIENSMGLYRREK